MSTGGMTYAEHVAFYQRQQLYRKRKQFELMGHPVEAQPPPAEPATGSPSQPKADEDKARTDTVTTQIPIAPPVDRTVLLRLRVESGRDAGAQFALTEGEYVIGRAADANIRLSDDTVSQHHAKVVV